MIKISVAGEREIHTVRGWKRIRWNRFYPKAGRLPCGPAGTVPDDLHAGNTAAGSPARSDCIVFRAVRSGPLERTCAASAGAGRVRVLHRRDVSYFGCSLPALCRCGIFPVCRIVRADGSRGAGSSCAACDHLGGWPGSCPCGMERENRYHECAGLRHPHSDRIFRTV